MAIGPTELTAKLPPPTPELNVIEVVDSVTPPVPAERLTAEPGVKLTNGVELLMVTVPEGPRADAEKAPPPVLVMGPLRVTFPVVAVAENEPVEARDKVPGILIAFVPAGWAPVINRLADPDVARVEVALVEKVPALSALPAMKVPVPAD